MVTQAPVEALHGTVSVMGTMNGCQKTVEDNNCGGLDTILVSKSGSFDLGQSAAEIQRGLVEGVLVVRHFSHFPTLC